MTARRAFSMIELIVVIAIMSVLFALVLAAVQRARNAADRTRCMNNLKQIGVALYLYHGEQLSLPPGCSRQPRNEPYPYMAWCTRLLPYLEQGALWQEAQAAYAADRRFSSCPPHVGDRINLAFLCPSEPKQQLPGSPGWFAAGCTHYLGVEGVNQDTRDGLLYLNSQVRFEEITDGATCTIMVGERPPDPDEIFGKWYAGWGQEDDGSADMVLGVREIGVWFRLPGCNPFPGANRFQPGQVNNPCDALHFWSRHDGGANFLFADGSVRFLTYSVDDILPALATRGGGEVVTVPD